MLIEPLSQDRCPVATVHLAPDINAAGRSAAVRSAGVWGGVGFVGEGGDVMLDVSPQMLRKQLRIIGSWTFATVGQTECARFKAVFLISREQPRASRPTHSGVQAWSRASVQG